VKPIKVNMVYAEALEAGVQVRFDFVPGHPWHVHRINSGMRAFCGKDETLSALAFAKPSADKFLTAMTSTRNPFGVHLGGVQPVASGFEVAIENGNRHQIVEGGAKPSCTEEENCGIKICTGDSSSLHPLFFLSGFFGWRAFQIRSAWRYFSTISQQRPAT
jgi:hypothetical protein